MLSTSLPPELDLDSCDAGPKRGLVVSGAYLANCSDEAEIMCLRSSWAVGQAERCKYNTRANQKRKREEQEAAKGSRPLSMSSLTRDLWGCGWGETSFAVTREDVANHEVLG